jgi:hypothetical protein
MNEALKALLVFVFNFKPEYTIILFWSIIYKNKKLKEYYLNQILENIVWHEYRVMYQYIK